MGSKTDKDYENLGRMLESLYEGGHANRKRIYKISFVKGLASGFGGVLGATILITALLWVLTLFKQVPFLGPLVDRVEKTVNTNGN
jgi:hypothetical protein